ncbi:hypothetical protein PMI14_03588 [Acidovorax sp. CF316]|uniref:SMI1/KNR4 family protein n=1 Tax=Acidovorax sp. CF316 TaxID=1144317 RepID=UPI00026BCFCF|nr:SMI1/KNR4 family protein [Acidovorax sp. CF316]EJE51726.1 hypothetical protein PMI14_03588 [Acidovorax sp. CF316]
MTSTLHDLQRVRLASGAPVAACRAALDAAAGHVADAIDLLARQSAAASAPDLFDGTDWFTGPPLARSALHAAQQALGFRFPAAYAELLLMTRNGGSVRRPCFAVDRPTSWATDHIAITGIRGIGGKHGIDIATEHAIHADWGYPSWGFVFAETPTAGHTVVMFDYRACGPEGEPGVVWVDTYGDEPEVIALAPDFTAFLAGLRDADTFGGRA